MIRLCAFADESSPAVSGQLAALKRNGIGLIEVRGLDGKNVSKLTLEEAEEYAKIFRDAGIRVWSVGSPIGKIKLSDDFEAHVELLHHVCRVAQIFGTDKVRMFSFYKADDAALVKERLARMVGVAGEYGVRLYHENEKGIFGDRLCRVTELLDSVRGLECVYDPANFIEVGEDAPAARRALRARVGYYHIKDVIAKTGQIVPAGYGDGDIAGLVRSLDTDAETVLTLEPHLAKFVGYSEIDNTEMKNKFSFRSNDEAFDAAVNALKAILADCGYKEIQGGYEK